MLRWAGLVNYVLPQGEKVRPRQGWKLYGLVRVKVTGVARFFFFSPHLWKTNQNLHAKL